MNVSQVNRDLFGGLSAFFHGRLPAKLQFSRPVIGLL